MTLKTKNSIELRFDSIYAEHISKIEYIAFNYLRDHDLAEEVAQEVFISFWNNIHKIDFEANIFAYLHVSARNACFKKLKRDKLKRAHSEYLVYSNRLLDLNNSKHLDFKEISKLLNQAYDMMPFKTKEAFVLSREYELKYEQIAIKQGVSVKNIEYRMMVALKILRKVFRDYWTLGILILYKFVNYG